MFFFLDFSLEFIIRTNPILSSAKTPDSRAIFCLRQRAERQIALVTSTLLAGETISPPLRSDIVNYFVQLRNLLNNAKRNFGSSYISEADLFEQLCVNAAQEIREARTPAEYLAFSLTVLRMSELREKLRSGS